MSVNRIIPLVLLLLLAQFFVSTKIFADVASGKAAGASAGGTATGAFGDKESFKNNITLPMTGGGTLMKTLDGSKSFDATMSAPSSGQFLEILMQPSGTGDLAMVTVGQDTDANGSLDYSFNLGVPVSGVCANGFISCTPGTWIGCQPHGWKSVEGKVTVVPIALTELGGCYCINSSCGSQLVWNNAAVVLKDLGGGIVAAIQGENGSTMVTDVQSDLVSIRYYGRVVSNTTSTASTPVSAQTASAPEAQAYYDAPASLTTARENISITQAANEDGLYYQMNNSVAFAGSAQVKRCSITKTGTITTQVDKSFSDSGTGTICTDHYVFMRIKKEDDVYTLQLVDTSPWGLVGMHHGCNDNPGGDGWHDFKTFTLPLETVDSRSKLTVANFSLSNINGDGCTPGGSMSMDGVVNGFNEPFMSGAPCSASGSQFPTFTWSYLFEFKGDKYTELVSDQCAAIDLDPTCQLRNEEMDGVVTRRNFNPTGLTPLPTCKTFVGELGNMEFCEDWWIKEREYACDTGSGWDFTGIKDRYNSINTSATVSGNALNYADKRMVNGALTSVSSTIILPDGEPVSDCMKSCKVKRARLDTQVGITGLIPSSLQDQNTYDLFYLPCEDDITCPSSPGDTVVSACACLNEFGQAASVLQLMRMGGGDSICSDGVPKQL